MVNPNCASCGRVLQADFRYCPYCGVSITAPGVCPNCGYQNEPNSKFCQECGNPLVEIRAPSAKAPRRQSIPAAPDIEPPPQQGLTIEFPFTTSQTFDFAVKAARAFPSFRQFGEDKKAIYRVSLSQQDLADASELLDQLKGWRRRTVYVDGQKVPWDTVFAYSWCYERKKASYKPELYCFGYENDYEFNIWGCTQARLPFSENSEWCTWGRWVSSRGEWEFDKQRITHELQRSLYSVRYCPALQPKLVEDVLAALPAIVNPTSDKNWKFIERWGDDSSPGLSVTVERFGFKETVIMRGVAPNGQGALKEMAKEVGDRLPTRT